MSGGSSEGPWIAALSKLKGVASRKAWRTLAAWAATALIAAPSVLKGYAAPLCQADDLGIGQIDERGLDVDLSLRRHADLEHDVERVKPLTAAVRRAGPPLLAQVRVVNLRADARDDHTSSILRGYPRCEGKEQRRQPTVHVRPPTRHGRRFGRSIRSRSTSRRATGLKRGLRRQRQSLQKDLDVGLVRLFQVSGQLGHCAALGGCGELAVIDVKADQLMLTNVAGDRHSGFHPSACQTQ